MQLPYRVRKLPSGLHAVVHAGVRGEVRWRVLDERGVPEIPRNPSGFAIAPIEGVRQSNLITDSGLDRIGTVNIRQTSPGGGDAFRRYLHIGTGSTAPAVSDIALVAEVQRGNILGLVTPAVTHELDTVNNLFIMEHVNAKAITLTDARNLTEFGFGDTNDANVSIRELFRDEFATPITVSLLAGKIIDVQHTMFTQIAAPAAGTAGLFNLEQYDATNTLVSTTPYTYTMGPRVTAVTDSAINHLFTVWFPASADTIPAKRVSQANAYARSGGYTGGLSSSGEGTTTQDAYIGGSLQRVRRATVLSGNGVGDWYGVVWAFSNTEQGFHVAFGSPATYAKPNTDTLEMSLTSSWGRV